jgi:hypothetical protein
MWMRKTSVVPVLHSNNLIGLFSGSTITVSFLEQPVMIGKINTKTKYFKRTSISYVEANLILAESQAAR